MVSGLGPKASGFRVKVVDKQGISRLEYGDTFGTSLSPMMNTDASRVAPSLNQTLNPKTLGRGRMPSYL